MSFKVGDMCVIVESKCGHTGMHCTITGIGDATCAPGHDCAIDVHGAKSWHPSGEWSAKFSQLRRIPPKDDPKSDFLPADDDFTRDLLKQLGRVTA